MLFEVDCLRSVLSLRGGTFQGRGAELLEGRGECIGYL